MLSLGCRVLGLGCRDYILQRKYDAQKEDLIKLYAEDGNTTIGAHGWALKQPI